MSVLLTVTWNEVAVSNVLLILTALLTTGEELKLAELNAVLIPLVSSLTPAKLMRIALLVLLLALSPKKSVLNVCMILTVVNPLLLVLAENKDALSVSSILTALLEKNVVLTRLVVLMTMTMIMISTLMELPFLASLVLACSWFWPPFSDFKDQ
jgi:pyruvate kinase